MEKTLEEKSEQKSKLAERKRKMEMHRKDKLKARNKQKKQIEKRPN